MDYFSFTNDVEMLDPFYFDDVKCEPASLLAVQKMDSMVVPQPIPFNEPEPEQFTPTSSDSDVTESQQSSAASPEPPTKKRKRSPQVVDPALAFVFLSREELLCLSSKQLQARVASLQQQRKFTAAEQKELKRQRRLVKNREYAQTSRLKKKSAIETYQVALSHLPPLLIVLQCSWSC
eukprot:TRINITY_DN2357_c0_g2_i1.p1 TRINITY_DN2357_c0_g2~~TRINITY_DN2357_c0_g2_i1.p1  ORF type:complete len:185 (-),score=56.11 TRINITY_DN2357_c0_g2_i1:42-575(-)